MNENRKASIDWPMQMGPADDDHYIGTGIANQVYVLTRTPRTPLHEVAIWNKALGKWEDVAVSGYTLDGRNITFITAPAIPDAVDAAVSNVLASAGAAITITRGTAAWVVNAYRGKWVVITAGTGAGQVRRILSNTATIITIETAWDTNPDATSYFYVVGNFNVHVCYQAFDACSEAYDPLTGCLRVQDEFPAGYDGEADALRVENESWSIRSDKDSHFTTAIAQDADEQENLTGLPSNKVLIENIMLQMLEPLDGEIWFYLTDTFDDTDLDIDSFKFCVEFIVEELKRRNNTGQYYLEVPGINKEYEDLDGTKELHVALVVRNGDGKTAGATAGAFILEVSGKRLG